MSVQIGNLTCGTGHPLLWIVGPCVIESLDTTMNIAKKLAELELPLVFKASFDKANRSSHKSFRGPGLKQGLDFLAAVNHRTQLPVTTDIHEPWQAATVGQVCDLIQIPALLCRQTDLLQAAAATGRPVNVKKGTFMAPWEMKAVLGKIDGQAMITERGNFFGYNRLVVDMQNIPLMQELGCPVLFDASHSSQSPGGLGDRSGGDRRMIPHLARAAVACGCDGIFLETHPHPDEALSDGQSMISLDELPKLIEDCLNIRRALNKV